MEPKLTFCGNWCFEHLAQRGENGLEFGVVALFHFIDFSPQVLVRGEKRTEVKEGAHDRDVHLDRALAAQHARKHRDAVLGESERRIPAAAMS